MAHDLLASQPGFRICNEQFWDEVFGTGRNRLPGRSVEVIIASFNFLEECKVVLVVEGWSTRKKNEKNNSHAPEVASVSVGSLFQNLGRHVAGRAARRCCQGLVVDETRKTEVWYLDDGQRCVSRSEQKIFGLYVSVNNAQLVTVDKRIKNWSNNVTSLSFCETFLLEDLVK